MNNRDHERHRRELLCVLALQEARWALGGFSHRLQVIVVCMICLAKLFVSDLTETGSRRDRSFPTPYNLIQSVNRVPVFLGTGVCSPSSGLQTSCRKRSPRVPVRGQLSVVKCSVWAIFIIYWRCRGRALQMWIQFPVMPPVSTVIWDKSPACSSLPPN